jgi:hypothetical protein
MDPRHHDYHLQIAQVGALLVELVGMEASRANGMCPGFHTRVPLFQNNGWPQRETEEVVCTY